MENIVLSIDGQKVSCPPGTSVLEAAEQHGIKIPKLCYHPDLKPYGACRLCLVEDEKTGRLMASCVTPAASNMVIRTATPRIINHRRNIARLMIAEHPESCVVCSKGNHCQLRLIASQLGIGETKLHPMPNYKTLEQANPFIIRDLSKCILCGKCIRADHELVFVGAIDYNRRGFRSRPATVHDQALEKSNCTVCGTCLSMCPTGALSPKNRTYVGSPARESIAICGFCGVGCSLAMGAAGEKIVEVKPAQRPDSVNRATLCVRGHFAHDFLNVSNRLVSPLVRPNGNRRPAQLVPASWDEALEVIAKRLADIKSVNGPQSIAFLGSSKCTNEENYLLQKFARALIGTNSVDNGGYIFGQSRLRSFDERTAGGGRVNPLRGLERAEAIVVLGADPGHSLPVVGYYLKRAAGQGIPLVLVNPRRTELVNSAALWLRLQPQTDLELLNGLTALLHTKEGYDSGFIDRYTEGFSIFRYSLSALDLERVCRVTDIDRRQLDAAADLLHGKKIAFVVGQGILQQKGGQHSLNALLNLALMTGSLGKEGTGLYMLAKENNQAGALDMGAAPDRFPGRQSLKDDRVRKQWEQAWKVKLSPDQGLNLARMIMEAEKGNLKALYVMGENPLRALPATERVQKALQKLDFLVVQDILECETTRMADVVLPGAAFCEKDGSFTNLEGRIQSFSTVVPPPGHAKPDWEILDRLMAKMKNGCGYGSLEKIRAEIRQRVPMYAELDGRRQGWLRATSSKVIFGADGADGLISFSPMVSVDEPVKDEDYPFTAIFGSMRYHLGSGTRTGASRRIQELELSSEIEISPQDAAGLNFKEGEAVNVISRHGAVGAKVRLKTGILPGQIFAPLAVRGNTAMNLIGLSDLAPADSPGWKTCQVTLKPA
ncbi:MAG: molybdopterin-dependent oxidoreductase [Desulfobacterales bacterium]|nr:MAG: molybdopterin-dependent oxidoreductase [Desulfobacterales bacterium]